MYVAITTKKRHIVENLCKRNDIDFLLEETIFYSIHNYIMREWNAFTLTSLIIISKEIKQLS